MRRSHLEKAISQHGGMAVVLARLGWAAAKRARKPRGYWSNLENVRAEIRAFIIEHHLPEGGWCEPCLCLAAGLSPLPASCPSHWSALASHHRPLPDSWL